MSVARITEISSASERVFRRNQQGVSRAKPHNIRSAWIKEQECNRNAIRVKGDHEITFVLDDNVLFSKSPQRSTKGK